LGRTLNKRLPKKTANGTQASQLQPLATTASRNSSLAIQSYVEKQSYINAQWSGKIHYLLNNLATSQPKRG